MDAAVVYLPLSAPPTHTWVLLRGLVREQRHWGDFPQQLAERLGARVYCPDLAGNGLRCHERSPLRLADTIDDLRRLLEGEERPIHLFGLSMGGMLAWEWARRYPEQVVSLVLVNSSFGNLSPPWQRLKPRALGVLMKALAQPAAAREASIYDLTCARQEDRAATLADWRRYAAECPVSRANFLRQLAAAAACRWHPLSISALLLSSREDRLADPACSLAIAHRCEALLCCHPWAGHDLPHDDPHWVLTEMARWHSMQ